MHCLRPRPRIWRTCTLSWLAAVVFTVGCGGPRSSRSSAELEIAPEVAQSVGVQPNCIIVPGFKDDHQGDRYVNVYLTVENGSAVLQFIDPAADVTVISEKGRLDLNEIKCSLQVESGNRTFRFSPTLTQQQITTLKSIRVNRLYERADEP